ncbi:MAG: hypothetical protein U0992_17410 [Planctomycetaceae bacterium]
MPEIGEPASENRRHRLSGPITEVTVTKPCQGGATCVLRSSRNGILVDDVLPVTGRSNSLKESIKVLAAVWVRPRRPSPTWNS